MHRIAPIVIIAIVSMWLGGLISFYNKIPDENVSRETLQVYDAIVVLTGGEKRIAKGVDLLKDGVSDKLLISGVYKNTKIKQVVEKIDFGEITLGDKARSTIGNAIEARGWLKGKDVESIILVTADYHMPRALSIFHRELPQVAITAYPVFPKDFSKHSWMTDFNTAKIIFFEYNKYLLSF